MTEARRFRKYSTRVIKAIKFEGAVNREAVQALLNASDPWHEVTDHWRLEPAADLFPDTWKLVPVSLGRRLPRQAQDIKVGQWLIVDYDEIRVADDEAFRYTYHLDTESP